MIVGIFQLSSPKLVFVLLLVF